MPHLRHVIGPLADSFVLPRPWDVARFVESVGRAIGRPILLLPTDTTGGACGLWVATEQADYIAYEQNTSKLHQLQIIIHELGHIIWQHPGRPLDSSWMAGGRPTRYTEYQEQQAETFASEILLRVGRDCDPPADAAALRVVASLDPGDLIAAPRDPDPRPRRMRWGLRRLRPRHAAS